MEKITQSNQSYLPSFKELKHWISEFFYSIIKEYFDIDFQALNHSVAPITLPDTVDEETFNKYVSDFCSRIELIEKHIESLPSNKDTLASIWKEYRQVKQMKNEIETKKNLFQKIDPSIRRVEQIYKKLNTSSCGLTIYAAPKNTKLCPQVTPGFTNSGSDCFINSILQGLWGDEETLKMFLNASYDSKTPPPISYQDGISQCLWEYQEALRKGSPTCLSIGHKMRAILDPVGHDINNGKQHDAPEVLQLLFSCLELSSVPFAPKIKETKTYENNNRTEKEDYFVPWIIELEGDSFAFESLLENSLREKDLSQIYIVDKNKIKRNCLSFTKQFMQRPEYLFLQFNRCNNGNEKIDSKIFLKETFFLNPQHVKSGEGGAYQVRWFVVHSGGTDGGHYYTYRKVGDTWYKFNDTAVSEVKNMKAFERDLQTCYFFFAKRINKEFSIEELSYKIEKNIESAKPLNIENAIAEALKLSSPEEQELNLLSLFIRELNQTASCKESLQMIFNKMPECFKTFVEKLGTQLIDLKTVELALTTQVNGNIIEQYQYIRKQLLELAKEDKKDHSMQGNVLRELKIFISKNKKRLEYEKTCLEHLNTFEDQEKKSFIKDILQSKATSVEKIQTMLQTINEREQAIEQFETSLKQDLEKLKASILEI